MSIRVAIVGPTSYTGYHLIRLLLRHPSAKLTYLASGRDELPNIAEEFPAFVGRCEMLCRPIEAQAIAREADVAFLCLPHVVAMRHAGALLDAGLRVVDLSADYRLRDATVYERVYGHAHEDRANLSVAAYGLPELFRDSVADADLVANPGCYPTSAALGIAPLLQRSLVKPTDIIINAASGVTGAGRGLKPHLQFAEVNEGFVAYNPGSHRHQPEIEQVLTTIKGEPIAALFVPHLLPIDQGILATIYLDPLDDEVTEQELYEAFEDAYGNEPFVRVRSDLPNVKHVRDTNYCDVSVRLIGGGDDETAARKVVVFSALDNIIKGASGQAIQNMNVMFSQDETAGLM